MTTDLEKFAVEMLAFRLFSTSPTTTTGPHDYEAEWRGMTADERVPYLVRAIQIQEDTAAAGLSVKPTDARELRKSREQLITVPAHPAYDLDVELQYALAYLRPAAAAPQDTQDDEERLAPAV